MLQLFLTLLLLCSQTFSQQDSRSTNAMECPDVKTGHIEIQKTAPIIVGGVRAYATVQLRRASDDTNGDSCMVTYKLFVAHGNGKYVPVKEYSEKAEGSVGAEMIGASKNEKVLAADFWWAEGDYTGHRPVIYDAEAKSAHSRALNNEIRKQLPSCDYFEEFIGVTDTGEAIIRVPKSAYVDQGCPAQGEWLFDVQSGRVQRTKPKSAPHK